MARSIKASSWLLALPFLVVACTHDRESRGGETITYRAEHSICLSCANFSLVLGPDGQGILTRRVDGVEQPDRRFRATPAQVKAFTDSLRPYRPKEELLIDPPDRGNGRCRIYATDGYLFDIRWQTALGPAAHLALDTACDPGQYDAMGEALDAAPRLLPIGDLLSGH